MCRGSRSLNVPQVKSKSFLVPFVSATRRLRRMPQNSHHHGVSQVGNGTAPADKTRMEYVVRRKSECRILVCTGQAHLFANRCQCT